MSVDYQKIIDADIRITSKMLSNISFSNAWGSNDVEEWEPVITLLMVEHLLNCGFTMEDEWLSNDGYCSVKKCVEYIVNNIHSDGSFGADFWDTCRFAAIMVEHNLCEYFDYDRVRNYIIDYVNKGYLARNNQDGAHSSDWAGPGTYAACAHYLYVSNEKILAKKVIDEVLNLQQNDGSFTGKKSLTGDNVIHPVWHTSQMFRVLIETGYGRGEDHLKAIIAWIESVMESDGGYGILPGYSAYYTSYAAMALQSATPRRIFARDKAYQYLLNLEQNGVVESDGGSVMALLAFDLFLGKDQIATIRERIELENLRKLRLENDRLKTDNKDLHNTISGLQEKVALYEQRYKDADIILSKRDGFWISIIITLIGIVFPVIVNLIIAFISSI